MNIVVYHFFIVTLLLSATVIMSYELLQDDITEKKLLTNSIDEDEDEDETEIESDDIVRKMSVELWGGLGNQMFQIAAGISLAVDTGRIFELSTIEDTGGPEKRNVPFNSLYSRIMKGDQEGFKEEEFSNFLFDPSIQNRCELSEDTNIILKNYFQSWKYFHHNRDIILHYMHPTKNIIVTVDAMIKKIKRNDIPIVSVHIRRGDYLNVKEMHVLGCNYYVNALSRMGKNLEEFDILFFSDDLAWVKSTLIPTLKHTRGNVHTSTMTSAVGDMWAMTQCDHHIIGNSTFSWWGSYLCQKPSNTTICPNKWFTEHCTYASDDIYMDDFIVVET
jgi:hypothetical protein